MAVCGACIAFFFEVYESIYTMSSGGRKPRSAGGAESGGPENTEKRKVLKERRESSWIFYSAWQRL